MQREQNKMCKKLALIAARSIAPYSRFELVFFLFFVFGQIRCHTCHSWHKSCLLCDKVHIDSGYYSAYIFTYVQHIHESVKCGAYVVYLTRSVRYDRVNRKRWKCIVAVLLANSRNLSTNVYLIVVSSYPSYQSVGTYVKSFVRLEIYRPAYSLRNIRLRLELWDRK